MKAAFTALLRKDIVSELRTKETVALVICLSLLLAVMVSFGVQSLLLAPNAVRELFPTLIWIIFVFAATVSIGKSFEYERENGALQGILLTGISPVLVYLSKLISNTAVALLGHLWAVLALVVLLDVGVVPLLPAIAVISFLVVLGYSALSTLLAAMTSATRLKNMLLPLVLLPLLFPLFFCAIGITTTIVMEGKIDFESIWISLLIGLDSLYLILGINLFESVVKE
jgi:heme exporter protein B